MEGGKKKRKERGKRESGLTSSVRPTAALVIGLGFSDIVYSRSSFPCGEDNEKGEKGEGERGGGGKGSIRFLLRIQRLLLQFARALLASIGPGRGSWLSKMKGKGRERRRGKRKGGATRSLRVDAA